MFTLMPCRQQELAEVYDGFLKTNTPLVSFAQDTSKIVFKHFSDGSYPQGTHDDVGLYIYIPKIANLLNISITNATDLFLVCVLGLGFMLFVGSVFTVPMQKEKKIFFLSMIAVFTGLFAYKGDVYLMSYLSIALFAFILSYYHRNNHSHFFLIFLIILFSILAASLNLFRSNSGTIFFILLCGFILIQSRFSLKIKLLLFSTFIITYLFMPDLLSKSSYEKRDKWFIENHNYQPHKQRNHVIWHAMYIGLGFYNNIDLKYEDSYAYEKVKSINPNTVVYSPEYESILKKSYFEYWSKYTLDAIINYLLKIAIVTIPILIFIWLASKVFQFNLLNIKLSYFLLAIAFGIVPSIIAVPRLNYALPGFLIALILLLALGLQSKSEVNT